MQIFSKGGELSLKVEHFLCVHFFFFLFYFLVLVLLFAHTERISVSGMQDAVNADFFLRGGQVVICENLFVSQFKSGNWQSQQQIVSIYSSFFLFWQYLLGMPRQPKCAKKLVKKQGFPHTSRDLVSHVCGILNYCFACNFIGSPVG